MASKCRTVYQPISAECRVQRPSEEPLRDVELVFLYRDIESGAYSVRRAAEFQDGRFERVALRGLL